MHPDDYIGLAGSILGLGLNSLLGPAKTKQERILARLDEAERVYLKRLASPEVKLAEAKRERKRQKLLRGKNG